MFSLQSLLGKKDMFFDLLEASAEEASSSVKALARFTENPEQPRCLDEFVASCRKEKAIATRITDALCTTFVTALEREDIEALSNAIYRIPKTIQKIAERILLAPHLARGVNFSAKVAMLGRGAETLIRMIKELRKGVRLEQIRSENDQLQAIESEADKEMLEMLKLLYAGKTDPVQLVFLKDLFELLEKVTDRYRDAGNVIVHIVLKNS